MLYDVMVYRLDEAGSNQTDDEQCFLIECDKSVTTDLQRHMTLYRVRKKVKGWTQLHSKTPISHLLDTVTIL